MNNIETPPIKPKVEEYIPLRNPFIWEQIKNIIRTEKFGNQYEFLEFKKPLQSYNIDSLDIVEIVMHLEEINKLQIKESYTTLQNINTFEDIYNFIESIFDENYKNKSNI